MKWIAARIKSIMLVSGTLTCTMFYAAIAPQAAVPSMFGEGIEGTVAELIARNWGVLIGLVLSHGRQFLGQQVGISIAVDLVMVALFVAYLGRRITRERLAQLRHYRADFG